MKVLLDTSVLLAGMLSDHVHHGVAQPWLARARAGAFELVVAGHSLAEVYAVLTRLPRTPRISPVEASQLLQGNLAGHTIVALSAQDYLNLIDDLGRQSVAGGTVYDAVIAKVAELAQVDHLLTLNTGHFQRVWPSGASRVVSPADLTPP